LDFILLLFLCGIEITIPQNSENPLLPQNKKTAAKSGLSSPSRARTYDLAVNSRPLYQFSYRGLCRTSRFGRGITDRRPQDIQTTIFPENRRFVKNFSGKFLSKSNDFPRGGVQTIRLLLFHILYVGFIGRRAVGEFLFSLRQGVFPDGNKKGRRF
jgi:hypothetical protein